MTSPEFEYFERRAAIGAMATHSTLVQIVDHEIEAAAPLIVYPKLNTRAIDHWLADQTQHPPKPVLLWIARQLLDALRAVHRLGYVHSRLEPKHCLIADSGELQLVGMGKCQPIGLAALQRTSQTHYAAPETAEPGFEYSCEQDIFAAGKIIHNLLGKSFSNSAILRSMTAIAPQDRPTLKELSGLFRSLETETMSHWLRPTSTTRRAA